MITFIQLTLKRDKAMIIFLKGKGVVVYWLACLPTAKPFQLDFGGPGFKTISQRMHVCACMYACTHAHVFFLFIRSGSDLRWFQTRLQCSHYIMGNDHG